MADERTVFYYDLSSPYSWLAAERINSTLPDPPVWRPISFGFLIREIGKTPWSMSEGREAGIAEGSVASRSSDGRRGGRWRPTP